MVRLFDDPDDELRLLGEFEQRRQQFQTYKRQATFDQTAAIVAMHQAYPYAKPGVKYALAASGIPADSPEAEAIAAQSGQAALAQGAGVEYGGPVQAGWFARNIWGSLKTVVRGAATIAGGVWHEAIARPAIAAVQSDPDFFGIPNPGYTGETFAEAHEAVGDSPLVRAAQEIAKPGQQVQFGGADNFLGQGFFPAGRIYDEHRAQLDKLKSLYGGDVSPGRAIAKAMHLDPSSKAFNVTSGFLDVAGAIYADPASKVLGGASKIAKARRTFGESADLFPRTRAVLEGAQIVQPRKAAMGEDVLNYLTREKGGRRLLDWVVETDTFDGIWRGMGRKVDYDTARRLADATDHAAAMDVLTDVLGPTIRSKPKINRLTTTRPLQNIRILGQMPGNHLDVDNVDQVLTQADDFLRNAKVPVDVRARRINELADIAPDDAGRVSKVWNVASKMMGDVEDQLGLRGRHASKKLTKMVEDYATDVRLYFIDEVGENAVFPGSKTQTMTLAGTVVPLPSAHLLSEYANTVVPLPSARALRRELSAAPVRTMLNALDTVPLVNTDSLENFMGRIWKPFQLLRGAWVVRVIGEEQVRMGASGMDSAFRHPLSYVGWMVGQKGATDLAGGAMRQADEFVDSMSRGSMGLLDNTAPGVIQTGDFVRAYKGSDSYMHGATTELGLLWNDEVAQVVAGAPVGVGGSPMALGAVKQWFYEGEGRPLLERLAASPGKDELLTNRSMADAYIDSVWKRVQIKTGGDPELVEAIATGQLRGSPVRWQDIASSNDPATIASHQAEIAGILAEKIDVLPDVFKAPRNLTVPGRRGKDLARLDRHDRVLNVMFNTLMSRPTNYLSRSTTFKQAYWDEAVRLLPYMDEATQQTAFVNAAKANLDNATLTRMRRIVDDPKQVGDKITDIYAADELAKAHGLDFTKNLLYDLSQRSQFGDVTRLIFPFAEAWKEVLTRWAKLGAERPQNLRRLQQVSQSGFFMENDSGDEVFNYPGGAFVAKLVGGVPDSGQINLQGRAQGLNLVTSSFLPGFGPVIQMPASAMIPDDPDWDGFMELVLPYGREDTSAGVLESQMPAWMQRLKVAIENNPESNRLYGNVVGDVMKVKAASGQYGQNGGFDQAELQRLYEDSRKDARAVFFLRAAAQFILPTGPSLEFSTETDAGPGLVTLQILRDEYAAMGADTAAGGWETATGRFIAKHGPDAALVLQGKTKPLKERAWDTVGIEWERRNPELVDRYDNVIGFFAPVGDPDEPTDYTAYMRQIATGALAPLTPEQQLRLSNDRIARNIYNRARDAIGDSPNPQERQLLRDLGVALRNEYAGYGDTFGVPDAADLETRIAELERAANDPDLAESDTAKGIKVYLAGRAAMKAMLARDGLVSFTSSSGAEASALLRDFGSSVARDYPGFDRVWTDVFEWELGDASDQEVLAA